MKGTSHWVSAAHGVDAEVRVYDNLFSSENPEAAGNFLGDMNPESLIVKTGCKVEPSLADVTAETRYQFLRQGYYCADKDSAPGKPVFNRTVSLKDSWAKVQKKG